jgi:hypothetical protein
MPGHAIWCVWPIGLYASLTCGPRAGRYGYYGVYAAENPSGPLVPTAVSLAMRASSELCRHEIAECQKTPDRTPSSDLLAALARYNVSAVTAAPAVSLLLGARCSRAAVMSKWPCAGLACAVRGARLDLTARPTTGRDQERRRPPQAVAEAASLGSTTPAMPPLSFAPSRRCRSNSHAAHGTMQV